MFITFLLALSAYAAATALPTPTLPTPPVLPRLMTSAPPTLAPTATPNPTSTPQHVPFNRLDLPVGIPSISVRLVANQGSSEVGNDDVLLTVFLKNHGPGALAMRYAPPWTDVSLTITDSRGKRVEAYDASYQTPDRQGRPIMLLQNEEMRIYYHDQSAFSLSNWKAHLSPGNYAIEASAKLGSPPSPGFARSKRVAYHDKIVEKSAHMFIDLETTGVDSEHDVAIAMRALGCRGCRSSASCVSPWGRRREREAT